MNSDYTYKYIEQHPLLKGFVSIFDLTGQTYIRIPDLKNGQDRDKESLRGDWYTVGNDLRRAIDFETHR